MKLYVLLLAIILLPATAATAQYVELLSDEALQEAAAAAGDSLGSTVVLYGASAPGPIDLSEIGIPVESDGLNLETGRSTVWGYLFRTDDSTDYIGIIILKNVSGASMIIGSRDFEFDSEVQGRRLKLDEVYSRSDAMVDRLRTDLDYIAFTGEYPAFELRETMLSWLPERPRSVPESFPIGVPVWQVDLMSDGFDSEEMTCFVSTGNGETICLRESSGVENRAGGAGTLSATPNIASNGEPIRVTLSASEGAMPDRIGLLDVAGAEVLDLSAQIGSTISGAEFEIFVPTAALPSGTYFLHATRNGATTMREIRIVR